MPVSSHADSPTLSNPCRVTVAGLVASVTYLSFGSVVANAAADAQGARPSGLEEVIVTAQRREQSTLDVPISITALSGDKLTEEGIRNAQELSMAVPGMSVQETGPGRQIITIRGIGSQKGTSSLTGVYLDEMSLSGLQDNFISTYVDIRTTDIERVEVLKGPQGTLFGEGSVGGTVRFVSRDPDLAKFGGNFATSVYSSSRSDDWSGEATGVLNVPVVEDALGFRIAASYENTAGWIDKLQTVNGPVIEKDLNDNELLEVRTKGLWKPTENLSIRALALVHRNEGGGSNIVNLEPRDRSNFIIEFEPTAPTGFSDDYELYNLSATYDFGAVKLLSSTSFTDMQGQASTYQRRPIIPTAAQPNGGFQEILQRDYRLESTSFAQELRLSSSGDGPLNWTLGAYYKDADLTRHYVSGLDVVRFGQFVLRGADRTKPKFNSKSGALFGDASYALTSRLELGAGVRYFEDDQEQIDLSNPAFVPLKDTFHATTYRSYLSYKIVNDVRVYGSVSTGFRSGGFNGPATIAQGNPVSFKPEEVTSYELGTKMRLADGSLGIEAALFYSEYTDIQGARNSPIPGLQGFIANAGRAEVRGVEVDLTWVVANRLTLSLNGDVTDTEITRIDETVPNPPIFVGDPIDFVPEYSYSIGADYQFDWSSLLPGYIRLQYNEQGEMAQTFRNIDSPIKQDHTPVLHFLSASIGADWSGWDVELFARNILDEDGALRPGSGLTPQARPTTLGVRVQKTF